MSSRQDASKAKRPSGGRALPRRLFSIDSLRKEKSGSDSDTSSIAESRQHTESPSFPASTLSSLPEKSNEGADPFADPGAGAWTEKGLVRSPDELQEHVEEDATPKVKVRAPKPIPLNLSQGRPLLMDESAPLRSPGKRRWDTLRSHVLLSTNGAASPPLVPPHRPDSALSNASSRPQTPKGYRFGQKKIFRQVVDQAREAAVDETRKFTEEICRACWAVRYGELPMRPKVEREASQGTVGSSLYLPFISSTTTLPMASSVSLATLKSTQKSGMHRPQSIQSMSTSITSQMPSMSYLSRVLTYTPSVGRSRVLPIEDYVLSTLLLPFLGLQGAMQGNERVSQEQEIAVETFEFVVRTWRTTSTEAELHRCLWCCKAASVPSGSRARILGTLSTLLFSRDKAFSVETPVILRTLLHAIFTLLLSLSSSSYSKGEADLLREFISTIRNGQCGTPSSASLEKEYGVSFSLREKDSSVRQAILSESVIMCLELGSEIVRRRALQSLVEEYWPLPEPSLTLTPLLSCMYSRKLKTFISAVLSLLSSPSDLGAARADSDVIIRLFRSRILPEVEALRDTDSADVKTVAITLVMELLPIDGNQERDYLIMHFSHWYHDLPNWKASIEKTLQDLIADGEWPAILRMLSIVAKELPDDLRLPLVSHILPLLNDRLMANSPECPCSPLSSFFDTVSRLYPKLFFKPVFTCAASAKDLTIANQICVLTAVSKYLPDFWFRDADMMAVALMSDATAMKVKQQVEGPAWGKPRIGQSVLLLELIEHLRTVRQSKDLGATAMSNKFVTALEARLGLLLEAKEQTVLVPVSQRILFCALFREIRMLTRSLKHASWLPSTISWTLYERSEDRRPREDWDDEEIEENRSSFNRLRALYIQAQDASHVTNKHRTTVFASPTPDMKSSAGTQDAYATRFETLKALDQPLKFTSLDLLVSVSGLLKPHDYLLLGPTLWKHCLDDPSSHLIAPTCFAIMQCAEKCPNEFEQFVESDLSHTDAEVRRKAVQRISTLASWRFQIMSQDVILDRNHRRPFKFARPPILFVPTDMGSNLFVLEEDPAEFKDRNGNVLPLELRRRLSEIGWEQEDRLVDPKTMWIRTPMSLLPSQQLVQVDADFGDPSLSESPSASPSVDNSPTNSPSGHLSLVRKDSSSGGRLQGAKRRPVFVPTLVSMLPRLASMVNDNDFVVANATRTLILDLMQDDPTLITRTIFHLISGDERSMISATSSLRILLHVRHLLPPAITHHILNHLAGFLKLTSRPADTATPLQSYAYIAPSIAKLVTQVSKMSMREIRRAKVDIYLIPSGSLWFPSSAPPGPMFPRSLTRAQDPFILPPELVWITMIRTSQNMLFLNMLKRDPGDVKVIRKSKTRFVLPSLSDGADEDSLPLLAFAPLKPESRPPTPSATLTALSLTLARSHLLLVVQLFRCMPRNLSDRQELAILVDGLNRILLAHGDDVGIVGHTMLAFMMASTRFKRLFISGGGYSLFMPAIFKTYCEAEFNAGIRAAIEYGVNRFYALHQESFVFQSIDVISHLFKLPNVDGPWLAGHVFALFSTLKSGAPPSAHDVAGVADINKIQEQEAILLSVAEDVPQTFFASLRKSNTDKSQIAVEVPEVYEWRRLGLDDFVRLFLTVIAHNPLIQRAERFLKLLRLLAPHLYNGSSSARDVLREGIDALGAIILTRGGGRTKADSGQTRPTDDFDYEFLSEGLGQGAQPALSPSDQLVMRLDYLSLVLMFTKAGGQLASGTPHRIVELCKQVLRDSRSSSERIAQFIGDYMGSVLLHNIPSRLKGVLLLLNEFAPITSAYCATVDFSGVFDVLTKLVDDPVLVGEPAFAHAVVSQYCRAGLEACELAASEDLLFSLPLRGSLIALMDHAVSLAGADVIAELVTRSPSYEFLVGILLPFVLALRTSEQAAADSEGQWANAQRRQVHSKAWIRLLAYILSACQNTHIHMEQSKSHGLDRRKSQDNRGLVASTKSAAVFTMALQILKVIVIRAENDIMSIHPAVWAQLGTILRTLFDEGDATFALRPRNVHLSDPPSPIQSPKYGQSFSEQQVVMSQSQPPGSADAGLCTGEDCDIASAVITAADR
ncbi:hypothetical protein SCP_0508370 [Sparassis crispa]|uniref:Uncharacterized protein n=1 Tax=Sparassis crispa TaxID=139825 RepID=A0A401GNG5_9APHY|nr:hypothetical protein SCP_0508370 [Sparassis crispa]GBE83781.1 hypothetical protein SCP_0508370 [Sparassis crispa]